MNRGQRFAIVLALAEEMQKHGSWCGETHVQKASFLLQELFNPELGYEFILYKHGPFAFDLHEDLIGMQADSLLETVVRDPRYRPTLYLTEAGREFVARFGKTVQAHEQALGKVARFLGDRGIAELERLATALFIKRQAATADQENRAKQLVQLKPHI